MAAWRSEYQYYLTGQLSRIVRPDGANIFFDFNAETGQLDAQVPSTGSGIAYHYDDESGDLAYITTDTGQTCAYTYDGSLPKSETWSVESGGTGIAGSVSRTFDDSFRVISRSVNASNAISFGYDTDDLLTSAGSMSLYRTSATGLLDHTGVGNITDLYDYNGVGEVVSYVAKLSGTTFYELSYGRDDLGRIHTKTELIGGSTSAYVYDYDDAGRLTDVTKDSSLIAHYNYDSNGNRIPDTSPPTINQLAELVDATYDTQDRLTDLELGSGVTVAYTYTSNGELLSKAVDPDGEGEEPAAETTYSYDLFGNLRQVVLPSPTPSATPTTIDYLIDGNNRRVGKKVNGTQVQGFLYEGQLNPVAELNGSNSVVSRFVYASKSNVPDYMVKSSTTYRIISDQIGSVRLVVNASSGAVAQRIDYDEFGNVLNDTYPGFQPFGFAGGLYDVDTGLVRFGARDYDPTTGRWTTKDPIGFQGHDPNLYGYVLNDPISIVDPTGRYGILGALGAASVNAALQFGANLYLSRDFIRSLKCINVVDVAVSFAAGGAGPTFLSNVLRGKLGPWAIKPIENILLWTTVSLPTGLSVKQMLPDVAFGDECEGMGVGKALGHYFTS